MSLLHDIQHLTERTYRESTGVNLEEFIIGIARCKHLSSISRDAQALPDIARVFFRHSADRLRMAIYFDKGLIRLLERHDPRRGISDRNITAFIVFIEEINHAVHGALKFLDGHREIFSEDFASELELLAKIDTYLILKFFTACFNPTRQLQQFDRLWLKHHLFGRQSFDYAETRLELRYREANRLGDRFTRFIDSIPPDERHAELKRFRGLTYVDKKRYISWLPH